MDIPPSLEIHLVECQPCRREDHPREPSMLEITAFLLAVGALVLGRKLKPEDAWTIGICSGSCGRCIRLALRCYSSARELRIACQMDSIATFLAECPLLYSPVACVSATHAASLTAIGICTYPEWKC